MRVIAGDKKGRRLVTPEGLDTRPTSDKVKEALKGTDTDAIKAASDALMQKMSAIGQRVYQEAAAQQQAQGNAGEQQGPAGAQDANFTDVN